MTTTVLGFTFLDSSQRSPEITVNDNVLRAATLDKGVLDLDLTAPPVSPALGDAHIIAGPATGEWAGHEDEIAYGIVEFGVYKFIAPEEGLQVFVSAEAGFYTYLSATWGVAPGGGTVTPTSTDTFENKTISGADNTITDLDLTIFDTNVIDIDGTLAANSDDRVPTQKAVRTAINNAVQGLDAKASVRVATTTAGTLATDFENGDTIDGIALATGNRILIKNQSAPEENGVYVVAASGAPARATDMDHWDEVPGAFVFVEQGTANADTGWICSSNAGGTLNTTAITWTQFSSAGTYTASTGLQLIGSAFSIDSTVATLTGSQTLTNKTLTAPVMTAPVLGTPASGNASSMTADGTNPIGFKNIPQNSQSTAYTTVLADAGKHILHPSADTTARTWTIDSNANVAYPLGTAITFINQNAGGVITIAITSDTMRLAGAGTTGNRSLAANGVATAVKITTTEWIISGTGLT